MSTWVAEVNCDGNSNVKTLVGFHSGCPLTVLTFSVMVFSVINLRYSYSLL